MPAHLIPRPSDRQRNPRRLDVNEQRRVVRREADAAKLRLPTIAVVGQRVDLAVRCDAAQIVLANAVLSNDQVAPRSDGDVVTVLDEMDIVDMMERSGKKELNIF